MILLSHEYPPFIFGGVGTFVKNLAHGLQKLGTEVTVIAGYPVPSSGFQKFDINQEEGDLEVNVIRFPYLNIPPRQMWFQVLNLKRLYKVVKRIGGDVIHGQSGYLFPALLSLKKLSSAIVTFHASPKLELMMSLYSLTRGGSTGDFYTYVAGYPIWMCSYRKEFEKSDAAVTVSETLMKQLMSEMGNKNQGKILYIHNGVDIEALEKEYSNVCCEKEKMDPLIFFAGRLFWRKGVLNLVELAYFLEKKYHLNLKIVIHGTGPLHRKMKKRIQEYGLTNIILKGFTTRDEFMKDMRRAICVVIPSFYEACPMLLLESMCLGKIPIMFNLPYALELTKNGRYGIIAHNIQEMAMKIKLLSTEFDVEHLGNKIRDFAKSEYDVVNTASKYYSLYKSIA